MASGPLTSRFGYAVVALLVALLPPAAATAEVPVAASLRSVPDHVVDAVEPVVESGRDRPAVAETVAEAPGPMPETGSAALEAGSRLGAALAQWSSADLGPIEPYASYDPQATCDPTPKPGAAALADLLVSTHPGTGTGGVVRACDRGPRSEHKEGRAFDWSISVGQREVAERALARLLASDDEGNPHALARRMGVMYIIWDGWIWGAYAADAGWRPYRGPQRHDDHVHISLSWDGAMGRTSLWRAARADGWFDTVPSTGPVPLPSAPDVGNEVAAPPVRPAPEASSATDPAEGATKVVSTTTTTTTTTAPVTSPPPATDADPTPEVPPPTPPPPSASDAPPEEVASTRLLVRFETGVEEALRDGVRQEVAGTLVRRVALVDGLEVWDVTGDHAAALALLGERAEVRRVEVDQTVVAATPSRPVEPLAPVPTAAAVIGHGVDPAGTDGVIGWWTNPAELSGNGVDDDGNGYLDDVRGWDFCESDPEPGLPGVPSITDLLASAGVPADVPILPLRVLCADGTARLSDVVAALDYAAASGLAVTVDGSTAAATGSAAIVEVVEAVEAAGHLVVTVSGTARD